MRLDERLLGSSLRGLLCSPRLCLNCQHLLAQRREGGLAARGLGKVRGPSPTPRQFCFEFSRWRVFTLSTFAASFNLQAKTIPHLKIVRWDLASFNALCIWKRRKAMWCGRIEKVYFRYRLINLEGSGWKSWCEIGHKNIIYK